MKNKKESRGFSNFGFSTILLSFVMICVVIFSALSLVTAYSDYKLSKTVAEKTQKFYAAEEIVYEKLIFIDTLLMECYLQSTDADSYYAAVNDTLINYGTLEHLTDGYYLSFKETIAENQHLSIQLQICYPTKDTDTFFKVTKWKSVYNKNTFADETLNLIQ